MRKEVCVITQDVDFVTTVQDVIDALKDLTSQLKDFYPTSKVESINLRFNPSEYYECFENENYSYRSHPEYEIKVVIDE